MNADNFDPGRRSFLKLGLSGSLLLGAAGLSATLAGCTGREQAAAPGYRYLRGPDLELLGALMPVVLAGMPLDAPTKDATLRSLDTLLIRAAPPAQAELRRLLDALDSGPMRRLMTGLRRPWRECSAADIERFLDRWRGSSIGLLNGGYRALTKLCTVPYFGLPAGYQAAGYPGPPAWMYKAINT